MPDLGNVMVLGLIAVGVAFAAVELGIRWLTSGAYASDEQGAGDD